jgi:hypothetical protein
MRRLFAIVALIAGGLANEIAHPFTCGLNVARREASIDPKRKSGAWKKSTTS